jgi:hypothetical protein
MIMNLSNKVALFVMHVNICSIGISIFDTSVIFTF